MTGSCRTTATRVTTPGSARLRLSHRRPRTFIGVVFAPHRANGGKFAPRCANRAPGRDLLNGRPGAAWSETILGVFPREDAEFRLPQQEKT